MNIENMLHRFSCISLYQLDSVIFDKYVVETREKLFRINNHSFTWLPGLEVLYKGIVFAEFRENLPKLCETVCFYKISTPRISWSFGKLLGIYLTTTFKVGSECFSYVFHVHTKAWWFDKIEFCKILVSMFL